LHDGYIETPTFFARDAIRFYWFSR